MTKTQPIHRRKTLGKAPLACVEPNYAVLNQMARSLKLSVTSARALARLCYMAMITDGLEPEKVKKWYETPPRACGCLEGVRGKGCFNYHSDDLRVDERVDARLNQAVEEIRRLRQTLDHIRAEYLVSHNDPSASLDLIDDYAKRALGESR